MRALASEYNADLSRFRSRVPLAPTKCILCGLCVRRCVEANWESAIGFIGRGVYRCIAVFPEKAGLCSTCSYCRDVCPTGRTCSTFGPRPPFPRVDDVLAGRK
jgi:formate hydrogenlyase subunit 6/NADH:ubiquinone oxidoreductase subunit I